VQDRARSALSAPGQAHCNNTLRPEWHCHHARAARATGGRAGAQIRNVILRALAASTEKLAAAGLGAAAGAAAGGHADAARLAQHTTAHVFKECLQARARAARGRP